MTPLQDDQIARWFVMRDLKRANAKIIAYQFLKDEGVKVFTPLKRHLNKKREWEERPLIHGLLFAYGARKELDPILEKMPTCQYRYLPKKISEPMVVPDAEMERFIQVVNATDSPLYYLPEEITPEMCGRRIRIVGGLLDGHEGYLLATRGSKTKRLLVKLQGFLAVSVEVNPNYIQLLKN